MITNLDKYKKHITQENGELRYRGYLIRVELNTTVDKIRIANVAIDFKVEEGLEGDTVEKFTRDREAYHTWLVYYEKDKPRHYAGLAFRLEDVFDSIDRNYQNEEE